MNFLIKVMKPFIILILLLISFQVNMQHANCFRVRKWSLHDNHDVVKGTKNKAKVLFKIKSTRSPTPRSIKPQSQMQHSWWV